MSAVANIAGGIIGRIEAEFAAIYEESKIFPDQLTQSVAALVRIVPSITIADAWRLHQLIIAERELDGSMDEKRYTLLSFAAWSLTAFIAAGNASNKQDVIARALYLSAEMDEGAFEAGEQEKAAMTALLNDIRYPNFKDGHTLAAWANFVHRIGLPLADAAE